MAQKFYAVRKGRQPKCHLNLFRLLYALHQAHTINQSDAMGICHNGWLAKDIAQNQIGTLTTHCVADICAKRI